MTAIALSVVIPTFQRRQSVLRLLTSLARQTYPPGACEVIVVVDGSTDGTGAAVRAFTAPYALSALERPNRGRAAACNAGIGAARGEIVILLDDDMEASAEFLAAHARAHEAPGRRAVVGAAPIVAGPDAPPFVRYMAAGFRSRLDRLARPGYRLRFRDVYTGNCSVRRDALLEVGGFDEGFQIYGHEDYELALRLQAAGVELTFSPEALAHQHYDKTFAAFARDGVARGRTAVLFAGKHPAAAESIRLGQYHEGPVTWRALRAMMLALSRSSDRAPERVVRLVGALERWHAPRLEKWYRYAIDYLFWYGARAAMREPRAEENAVDLGMTGRPAASGLREP